MEGMTEVYLAFQVAPVKAAELSGAIARRNILRKTNLEEAGGKYYVVMVTAEAQSFNGISSHTERRKAWIGVNNILCWSPVRSTDIGTKSPAKR